MKKFVNFKGGLNGVLKPGCFYKVEAETRGEYKLEGIEGLYSVGYFDDVPIFVAVSSEVPVEGERYLCMQVIYDKGKVKVSPVISTPKKVYSIDQKTFMIAAHNSLYIVAVE